MKKFWIENVLHPFILLNAVNPRSEEAFYPFKNMSFKEWKLHIYYRNGSSYLARLRASQKLLKEVNI